MGSHLRKLGLKLHDLELLGPLINNEKLVEAITRRIHKTLQFLSTISTAVHSTYNKGAALFLQHGGGAWTIMDN
jgi:gentisate 1,2-dioxygenase